MKQVLIFGLLVITGGPLSLLRSQIAAPGSITGRIVDADTGGPIPGAFISGPPEQLTAPATPAEALLGGARRETTTDRDGLFAVNNVPPGRVQFRIRKEGYIPQIAGYSVVSGKQADVGKIKIYREGVLAGRVLTSKGTPAPDIDVSVYLTRVSSGRLILVERTGATTDDRGEFRIVGLRRDRYAIGFRPGLKPGFQANASVERWNLPPDSAPPGYAPLLYPGVGDLSKADWIDVVGEVRLKDVLIGSDRLGTVSIHVVSSRDPSPLFVDFAVLRATPIINADYSSEGVDGGLCGGRVGNVRMRLDAGNSVRQYWLPKIGVFEAQAHWVQPDGTDAYVAKRFEFTGHNLDVTMDLFKPRESLDVHIAMELAEGTEASLPKVRINLEDSVSAACVSPQQINVTAADGRVQITELSKGVYNLVGISNLPPNSYVASAVQGGRSVLENGIEVGSNDSVEIRIRQGLGRVEGRVIDDKGAIVSQSFVSMVPEAPLSNSILLTPRPTVTDQEGRFVLSGVVPGKYRIYVQPSAVAPKSELPSVIAQLGVTIEVIAGQETTLDVPIAILPTSSKRN